MEQRFTNILANFQLDGTAVSCELYGFGHINETYLVITTTQHRYILQKINNYVFKNVPALMENIAAVTGFLQTQEADSRRVLQLIPTVSQEKYLEYEGSFWRIFDFVEDSIFNLLEESLQKDTIPRISKLSFIRIPDGAESVNSATAFFP